MLEQSRVRGCLARTPESIYEVDICHTLAMVQHLGSIPHIFEDSFPMREGGCLLSQPPLLPGNLHDTGSVRHTLQAMELVPRGVGTM